MIGGLGGFSGASSASSAKGWYSYREGLACNNKKTEETPATEEGAEGEESGEVAEEE